jgi:hypothetical protein
MNIQRMETAASIVVLALVVIAALIATIAGSAESTFLRVAGLISLCGLVRHLHRLIRTRTRSTAADN